MKSILGEANIKKILQKTVPSSELKDMNKYDVETLIKKVDHYLVIKKCMPHNCSAELAMVIIDAKIQIYGRVFLRERKIEYQTSLDFLKESECVISCFF